MQYPELLRLAKAQHGVLSVREAEQFVTDRTLRRWRRSGLARDVFPRVLCFDEVPAWRQVIHAVTLWSSDVAVSHRSSGQLWHILPFGTSRIEVIGPPDVSRDIGATIHESNCLLARHITMLDGTRTTIPERTIVDLSAVWSRELVNRVIEKAMDARLITIPGLRRTLEEMRRRGRRRTTYIDTLLETWEMDNPNSRSWLEREGLRRIRNAGLPEPVLQMAVPLPHITLHPDLCYPEARIAIELDGWETHRSVEAFHEDRERDALLAIQGWTSHRFSARTIDLLVPMLTARLGREAS